MKKTYSGRGDAGETDLLGGKRVRKSHPRVAAMGDIDELNAVIGVVLLNTKKRDVLETLRRVQNDLFTIGAELSVAPGKKLKIPNVTENHVRAIEDDIEKLNPGTTREFVIPGGSAEEVHLQLARAVARRAERSVVGLAEKEEVNPLLIEYLNRLSSLLYVLALSLKRERGAGEEHPKYQPTNI